MNPSLHLYNKAALDFIHPDFEIETLSTDCVFTEGPVWNPEGYYLFSDITANSVYKISPGEAKEIFIADSGTDNVENEFLKPDQAGSNALAYDRTGNLLVCRHGSHEIASWNGAGLQPYVNSFNGKPFNSPNDLVVDENGRVFFSDPPYGLKDGKLNATQFQPIAGVYCADEGNVSLICDRYQYPNGVCITPDKKQLYVCSNKPFEEFISVYNLTTLQFKKILAEENSDGIKCDSEGHIYLCTKEGVVILNVTGERLAKIEFSSIPANCCWGGSNGTDLFITARENIFLIRNLLRQPAYMVPAK